MLDVYMLKPIQKDTVCCELHVAPQREKDLHCLQLDFYDFNKN